MSDEYKKWSTTACPFPPILDKIVLALQKQKDKLRTSVIIRYLIWIGVGKLILDDRGAGVD